MKFYLLILCTLIIILACRKEEKSIYFGCCGNPAINESVGNANVYMPNVFTPNNDGINDRLTIYADSIQNIISLEIRNKDNVVVFERVNFLPNNPLLGWDGKTDGVTLNGVYSFITEIEAMDRTIRVWEGEVCNHPCNAPGSNESELIPLNSCQFPEQADVGHHNPNAPSGEINDCFE